MGPAEGKAELLSAALGERCIAAIAVDLQDACKISKVNVGPLGLRSAA